MVMVMMVMKMMRIRTIMMILTTIYHNSGNHDSSD